MEFSNIFNQSTLEQMFAVSEPIVVTPEMEEIINKAIEMPELGLDVSFKKCDTPLCGEPVHKHETICKDCVERCYCGAECETDIKGDRVCWDCYNIFKKASIKLYNMIVSHKWQCPCHYPNCDGGCGVLDCGCIDVCRCRNDWW